MTFRTDLNTLVRMNCNNLGDSLTVHIALSLSEKFDLSNTLLYEKNC